MEPVKRSTGYNRQWTWRKLVYSYNSPAIMWKVRVHAKKKNTGNAPSSKKQFLHLKTRSFFSEERVTRASTTAVGDHLECLKRAKLETFLLQEIVTDVFTFLNWQWVTHQGSRQTSPRPFLSTASSDGVFPRYLWLVVLCWTPQEPFILDTVCFPPAF